MNAKLLNVSYVADEVITLSEIFYEENLFRFKIVVVL